MNVKTNAEKEWLRKMEGGIPRHQAEDVAPVRAAAVKKENTPVTHAGSGFQDVAGMDDLKQLVTEGFINVLNNKECAKAFRVTPPSLLFYGPSGCGKTYFAEKIAEEVGVNFMKIVPDDIASTLVHGVQEKLADVFRRAAKSAPTLIFFDEFDAMVPHRSCDDRNYQNGEVNEFLCLLNNASEKGIYVLAATNHPERIDKAVLRTGRIDELIYVDMPNKEARESLFRLALSKLPTEEGIDFVKLADMTKGYNYGDISYIIKVASRKMFNASIAEKEKPYKVITQGLLEDTITHKAPSVSSKDLREYERIRSEFSPKDAECRHQTIGFH